MNHIKEIEVGHEYQIIDRSTGEFGNSCSLKFIKIMGGEVDITYIHYNNMSN